MVRMLAALFAVAVLTWPVRGSGDDSGWIQVQAGAGRAGTGTGALESVLNATSFRNIGPFRTSAWVTEIAVPEKPLASISTPSTPRPGPAASGRPRTTASRGRRSADGLHRRAGVVPIPESGRRVAGDQPGPHVRRRALRPELRLRAVLHDHVDRGISGDAGRHLDRHGRREGARDAGSRRRVDGGDGRDRLGGRAGGPLREPCVRLAARRGDGVRREERLPQRRLPAVPLPDDGLREDVDGDRRRLADSPINRTASTRTCSSSATTWACGCRSTRADPGRG